MTLWAKDAGAWVNPTTPYIKVSGAWVVPVEIFVKRNGVWESVWV
jgi:hypothetical protein